MGTPGHRNDVTQAEREQESGVRMLLLGAILGAGAAYFLDRERGAVRRERLLREARSLVDDLTRLVRPAADGAPRATATARPHARRHDDLPGLGGAELRASLEAEAPAELLGLAGGVITAYGLTRRDRLATAMTALGAGIMATGVVQNPAMGIRDRRRAVDVQRTVQLDAAPETVLAWWTDGERLAQFLTRVDEVRELGAGRLEWHVQAAFGTLSWGATVTALEPGRLLAWRSDADAPVGQSATVRVTPTTEGTQLDLRITYAPAAGDPTEIVELLGWDPRDTIDDDLATLAHLLEVHGTRPDTDTEDR